MEYTFKVTKKGDQHTVWSCSHHEQLHWASTSLVISWDAALSWFQARHFVKRGLLDPKVECGGLPEYDQEAPSWTFSVRLVGRTRWVGSLHKVPYVLGKCPVAVASCLAQDFLEEVQEASE